MSSVNGSLHGYNLFAYCFNNPIALTDSSGNWPNLLKGIVKCGATLVAGYVKYVETIYSYVDLTYTIGLDISVTTRFFTIDVQNAISFDTKGNVVVQDTGALGASSESEGGSAALSLAISNAPSVYALNGEGTSVGGSVPVIINGVPASISADCNIIPGADETYYGLSMGVGTPSDSPEVHYKQTYTEEVEGKRFNFFNWFEKLYGRVISW